ncbi:RICIN domain-containing protein [Halobacteria archaeon HArc-gm2]|nr:RICIN domain-containing protein [Halobacteria archaeon HArc-gm2]
MTDRSNHDRGASNENDPTRRTFLKTATAGAVATAIGTASLAGPASAAHGGGGFHVDDGFADTSWLDDGAEVIVVEEATREAVEAAFQASGPRIVAFATSGTIDLGGESLEITNDQCWVAGQTAPSPGITFVNGQLQVDANDCVVQHVRTRIGPGDGDIQSNDSLNTADGSSNNVVDHVTATWGTDECMSVGYDSDATTFSNNIIAEGLWNPYGDEADHNYATLVGDGAERVALIGNVWAKTRGRVPRLKSDTRSVVVNNLAYFFDEAANADDSAETSFVGNVYAGTADTGDPVLDGGSAFVSDNVTTDPSLDSDQPFAETNELGSRPLWPSGLSALSSGEVESHNLSNAGARPADRTEHDQRVIREVRDRAGNDSLDSPYDYWVATPDDLGGYPQLPENSHSLNPPSSGLREWLAEWAAAVETGSGNPGSGGGGSGSDGGGTDGGSGDDGSDDGSGDGGSGDGGGDSGGTGGTPIGEGTYRITSANSGKFLEVASADTSDGANVQQWGDTGHPCQEWDVTDNGDGTCTLTNAHSGKLLEVANADTSDGANVRQYSDTNHACQHWRIVDNGDGTYRLENAHSGKVADVEGASTADGANVLQWAYHGGDNQRWSFEQV